jgi:signal transduction protein with GAF and PtsI domain
MTNTRNLKMELAILYRVSETVHSVELNDVLQEIVDIAIEVTGGDSCLIYLHNQKNHELILRASKNPHPELLAQIKLHVGEGITGWVAKEKKPVAIASDAHLDKRFKLFHNLPEDRYEAFLSVPMLVKNDVVGVINIQHKKIHTHSETEITLLSAIGKLVGGAVENAHLIEETLSLKEALEVRKSIEKAKGLLMKHKHMDEQDAYHFLQQQSMKSRTSIKEICDAIILAEKILK